MRKSFWFINLILLLGAAGLVWKLHADWRLDMVQNGPQSVRAGRLSLPGGVASLAPRAYGSIAQQNPFSADRNDIIVTPQQAAAAVPLGPPPLYYGSVILGNERFALLGSPTTNSPPQRVAEGQTFNGYKVAQVHSESVVFQTAAGTSELMLYNAIARLRRSYTKTQTATSATNGTGAAPPAAAVTSTAAPAASAPPAAAAASAAPTTDAAHAGKHLMQTPFGPIWVNDSHQ